MNQTSDIEWKQKRVQESVRRTKEQAATIDLDSSDLYQDTLHSLGFTDEQLKLIFAVEQIVCMDCREEFRRCSCINDE